MIRSYNFFEFNEIVEEILEIRDIVVEVNV